MAKLILQPQFGTIQDSKKVKYSFEGLDSLAAGEYYKINFENTTFSCKIDSDGEYLDLNVPPHSSQSAISIFANIFIIDSNGKTHLKEICPAIFSIQEKIVNKFEGDIQISPIFASPKDLCSIKISSCVPGSRTVFSINDRRMAIRANEKGEGSIHFVSKDVVDKDPTSIQKVPIYFYSENDNYVRKNFSGTYINFLPQKISSFADAPIDPRCTDINYIPGGWNYADDAPSECFGVEGPTLEEETPIDIVVGTVDIPTSRKCDGGSIPIPNLGCRINNYSSTLLNNGRVAYAYTNVDVSITNTDSPFYNKNRITIVDNNSSVTVPLVLSTTAAIAPKTNISNFDIYVSEEVYNALGEVEANPSAAHISVLFYDESIGYQSAQVIGRRTEWIVDPEAPSLDGDGTYYIISAEDENVRATISDWLFCVGVAFYKRIETSEPIIEINSGINTALGYVLDADENVLQTNNVSIASNKNYLSLYDESIIYLIAESFVDGKAQLFFASGAVGVEYEANNNDDLYFGWKQITFNGNNINPKAYVDDTNTLHVFWESDRSGSWKIYYGCLGSTNEFSTNAAFASMVDKQAELFMTGGQSLNYLFQNILEDKTTDDPSAPVPELETEDILTVFEWQDSTDKDGVVTHSFSGNTPLQNVSIAANAMVDEAISFVQIPIYDISRLPGDNNSLPYSQINYQVSFNLTSDFIQPSNLLFGSWDGNVINKENLDDLFKTWKSGFAGTVDTTMSNFPAYTKNGNLFVLGRQDNIFENVIPFFGAYDTSTNPGDPSNDIASFQAKILKEDNTLKDFMFGFMLEKSRFKATNARTVAEHNAISSEDYILEEEHIIFTGRAKLIAFVRTEDDNTYRGNYCILREFTEIFDITGTNLYEVVVNYTKIGSNEVKNVLDTVGTDYFDRFVGRVSLLIDGDAKFSQSFVSELSYNNTYFDIGLGVPFGGYLVSDRMTPSTSGIFDDIRVQFDFKDIKITSPIYSYNPDVVYLPPSITNMTEFRVLDIETDPSNDFIDDLLNFGINDVETTIFTDNILRCFDCPEGNVDWDEDYDVSNIQKLVYTIDTGSGTIRDGIIITDNSDGSVIYNSGLILTQNLPGRTFTEEVGLAGYSNINIQLVREIPNGGYVELDLDFRMVSYENKFSQIPISMDGICKAPNIAYGICNDAHIVWQSNLNNYWDIYYSNGTDKLRPFRFDTRITNTDSNSIMPAVSVNKNGKRMIVWHDNRNGNFDIYSARSLDGYTCDQSFCEGKMSEAYTVEITQCLLSFNYSAPSTGFYEFAINFYSESSLENVFKVISSDGDPSNWFVDGVSFDELLSVSANGNLGILLNAEEVVAISYSPGKEDGIFDRILYAKLVGTIV